jgi:ribosomal protein L7/L12
VTIEGWAQGAPEFGKIALTKLIRNARGYTLSEAKACTDDVTEGRDVVLTFSTEVEADAFCQGVRNLGAAVHRESVGDP